MAAAAVARALNDPVNETPKPGDAAFADTTFELIARPADSVAAATEAARGHGYECVFLGDRDGASAQLAILEKDGDLPPNLVADLRAGVEVM